MFGEKFDAEVASFWNWFERNAWKMQANPASRRLANKIAHQLGSICPFMMSATIYNPVDGRFRFMLAPGLNPSNMPVVVAIIDAAPTIPNWDFVAEGLPSAFSEN